MSPSSSSAVLIVDDVEDCIATLDISLQNLPGVVIRPAASAEEAMAILDRETISAVITDLQLPAMNGLELISWIREQARFNGLPIVALSAAADPALPRAALERGANAFFPKPFSPGAVRKKLEELIYAR